MNFRNVQAPTAVVMIRPHRFAVNPQTLADNAFQVPARQSASEAVATAARNEFDDCVDALVAAGVGVPLVRSRRMYAGILKSLITTNTSSDGK